MGNTIYKRISIFISLIEGYVKINEFIFFTGWSSSVSSADGQKNTENKCNFQQKQFAKNKETINSELSPSFTYVRGPSYNKDADKLLQQQINNVEQKQPSLAFYSIPTQHPERIAESKGSDQQSSNNQESNSVDSIASFVSNGKSSIYKPSAAIQTATETKSSRSLAQTSYNQHDSSPITISSPVSTRIIEPHIASAPMLISTEKKPSHDLDQAQPVVTLLPIKTTATTSSSMNLHGEVNSSPCSSSTVSAYVKHLSSLTETNTNSGKPMSHKSSSSTSTKQSEIPTTQKYLNCHHEKKTGKSAKKHKSHHKESLPSQKLNNQESFSKHRIHDSHHHKNSHSKNKLKELAHHKKYSDTNKSHHKHDTEENHKVIENVKNKTNSCQPKLKEKLVNNNECSKSHKEEDSKPSANVVIQRKPKNELTHKTHSKKHHKNKEGKKQ